MDKAVLAREKLRRIHELWDELERTRLGTPEYETLMKKIRALVSAYRALVGVPEKPEK